MSSGGRKLRFLIGIPGILAVCTTVGVLALAAPSVAKAGTPAYTLGSGDRVRITVFGEKDLSGEYKVSGTGVIAVPLIGDIAVAGLTMRQLEHEIAAVLMDGYLKEPRVNAEVVNYRPFYILGEVKRPGGYPYVHGMTVINAVALSGGFTQRAQKSRVTITRLSDTESPRRTALPDDSVLPGDVIRVPERFF